MLNIEKVLNKHYIGKNITLYKAIHNFDNPITKTPAYDIFRYKPKKLESSAIEVITLYLVITGVTQTGDNFGRVWTTFYFDNPHIKDYTTLDITKEQNFILFQK